MGSDGILLNKEVNAGHIYTEEIHVYIKEQKKLEASLALLFSIVCGQCSKLMKQRLMAADVFDNWEGDTMRWILMCQYNFLQHQAKKKLYAYYQAENDNVTTHLNSFMSMVEVIGYFGGNVVGEHKKRVDNESVEEQQKDGSWCYCSAQIKRSVITYLINLVQMWDFGHYGDRCLGVVGDEQYHDGDHR